MVQAPAPKPGEGIPDRPRDFATKRAPMRQRHRPQAEPPRGTRDG
jgi:hypothetical protein